MTTWTIYHNPRCSKSRQALEILKNKKIEPKIIEYLKDGLPSKKTEALIANSKHKPAEFLRKKEKEFSDYKDIDTSSARAVAKILKECPKLLERPIVTNEDTAIIARPPELVLEIMA